MVKNFEIIITNVFKVYGQIISPFIIIWFITKVEKKITLLARIDYHNNIINFIHGKDYVITKSVRGIISNQKREMKNKISKTNDETEIAEIKNFYTLKIIEKIEELYDKKKFTISEIGYRLNVLNSDVNYFMCVFTGLIATALFEIESSNITQIISLTQTSMQKLTNNISFVSFLIADIIVIIIVLLIIVFLIYFFRRIVVVSLNKDSVLDEAEKCIIKKVLEKYKVYC